MRVWVNPRAQLFPGTHTAMFGFSASRLALNRSVYLFVSNAQGILPFYSLFVIRFLLSSTSSNLNEHSFIVSYLINSCGLTLKSAQSISKRICFETTERPDSVLRLLREHGFTNSHISKIVKSWPRVLLAQPEKTLLPKFEFLRSLGVSSSDMAIIVSRNPFLLARSIERYLIPRCEVLKSLLVSDEKVVTALKRMGRTFSQNSFSNNLAYLRGLGVPHSFISHLVTQCPSIMCQEVGKFAEGVKKVMKLGFDPSKVTFVEAVRVFYTMTHKTWEHKMEVYRRWGLSEDEIWLIFRKHPTCLARSEKKIMGTMDFLVCKMGWQPSAVARVPIVLCCSLERRILPRCSVVRVLLLKGLIKGDIHFSSVLMPSEKRFLELYVIKYQEQVPQLLDLFQGKTSLTELGFGFDDKSGILRK
ncbi:transcription termination factor MTERF15, mitochondrial isoform X2 [Hevea brasiliensis]|uniref:transcription termination factor MTERF15, mitochondrial isoform X2 n=1 Tax=Hevea brasiliensis TaxID=3981 RepID=UPI0025E0BC92|nr:transcription termination factor MTERF15, mitochondrial isoform X2 [Hevea brasiliensis]